MGHLQKKQSGFSLVEIVIAIAVIGIMSAAAVPLISSSLNKSRQARVASETKQFSLALVQLFLDTGSWHGYHADCTVTSNPKYFSDSRTDTAYQISPHMVTGSCYNPGSQWLGPYLSDDALTDPWGNLYRVQNAEEGASVDPGRYVYSAGVDQDYDSSSRYGGLSGDDAGAVFNIAR